MASNPEFAEKVKSIEEPDSVPVPVFEKQTVLHKTVIDIPAAQVETQHVTLFTNAVGESSVRNHEDTTQYPIKGGSLKSMWLVLALFGAAILFTIIAIIWKHHQ
jgi:hypothetical protein